MDSAQEVNRRALAVVATVLGYAGLIAVVWFRPTDPPQVRPLPVPVADDAQTTAAVQEGVRKGRIAIQNTVKNLVPGATCDQVPIGDTLLVRIIANTDFYDPGDFQLADSPEALGLAQGMADAYGIFKDAQTDQFKVSLVALGTSDAIPVGGGIDYEGPAMRCFVGGSTQTLEPGPKTLNNALLACARAAALAQYVLERMPADLQLKGREHGEESGRFRSVDAELKFIGILRYAPDADFCGS